jgi:signal transduction histidine kinase
MSQPQFSVDFRLTNTFPIIRCDRAQVSELFTNLISNAIKYNDKPERWVEIGCLPVEQVDVPLTLHLPASEIVFFVRDNGIGIPSEYQQKIFQIFRRLHERDDYGGGTGAGLTIARKIVERHGGQIWVQSTPGEGSTFYFMVPEEAD